MDIVGEKLSQQKLYINLVTPQGNLPSGEAQSRLVILSYSSKNEKLPGDT